MYLLDTNILITAMRHPLSACAKTISEHLGEDICISVVTYAELEFGIRNSRDPERNRRAVQRILSGIPILPFGIHEAADFGAILAELRSMRKDKQNQDRDKMIAAHARSNGYTLVTANIKDFEDIHGLAIENWLAPADLEL